MRMFDAISSFVSIRHPALSYETNHSTIEIHSHIHTQPRCRQKKKKKAIYFSSLEYGASLGEIAEAEQIICSQLMEMQTKQKKTMNAN